MHVFSRRNQKILRLSPGYLTGIVALLAVILAVTAMFEYRYRKSEIDHLMHEEASLLIHALSQGAENAIIGYNESRTILARSMIDKLHVIDQLDRAHPLTSVELDSLVRKTGFYRVNIFDRDASRIASSTPPDHVPLDEHGEPLRRLAPIFSGKLEQISVGIRESASGRGYRFIVAIARSRGGAIAGNVDAGELLRLKNSFGAGKLIRKIAEESEGIVYIIWQDMLSIVAATPNIAQVDPIASDSLLSAAMFNNSPVTRTVTFNGDTVYEVIKPFYYQGDNVGLIRIGLRNDHFENAMTRLRKRLFMIVALLMVSGLVLVNLVVARRNELDMTEACVRVQTFASGILDNMGDAVVVADPEGRISLLNNAACTLFGISPSVSIGKSVRDVLPCCAPVFVRLLATPADVAHEELMCSSADDRNLVVQGNFSVLYSHLQRTPDGIIAVLRDVTAFRSMQALIERRDKLSAMGELASGVAHEIRNPLNAIAVLGQRLEMEFTPDADKESYHRLLQTIISEVHRVNGIIERFLEYAKPPVLQLELLPLAVLLKNSWPVLQSEAESRGVRVVFSPIPEVTLKADRSQLHQVLLNLVRNAVDASVQGSEVRIGAELQGEKVAVFVSDEGEGIDPEQLSRIFNLYYTTRKNGTGLGLGIAYQIILAHGGDIQVESRKGEGSTFRVILPIGSD